MSLLEVVLLGLLQGLTEFLPVSSSGHLVIAQHFLGIKQAGVTFEVMVHFGTLLSIMWVFKKDLSALARGFLYDAEQKRLFIFLIVGTIPTALMGLLLSSFFLKIFESPFLVGIMLLVSGLIVFTISRIHIEKKDIKNMTAWDAVTIGIFQGIAIIPGITRSGSTILGALWKGLNRETAVRYSFLLALPAIAGATFLEFWDWVQLGGSSEFMTVNFLAAIIAFISGVFAIKVFIKLLERGKFYYLAYYCWFVGTLTVVYTLFN
ncbi:MAG: undecaprenyl-diphosphate phosphatase [Bacillota bacterium]|nr:undecaprenyl-diphosphate phosphatase [Bacillota bacterium]